MGAFYYTMNLKITIVYKASQKDWDVEEVVDGRKITDQSVREDVIKMLLEDAQYVLMNSEYQIEIA
jgi:hypothetical protein